MSFPAYPAYRESGNPWIGALPVGWNVIALKRDLQFLTSGSRGWADHYADEGALFLRIGNLSRDALKLDLRDIQRVAVPVGTEGERTRVESGDVLFSITAFMGSIAVVPHDLECAYVSQHVALARLRGNMLLPRWVGYMTLSAASKAYLDAQCYGGTKIQLSLDDVANLPVSVPPIAEQFALITFLDRETGKIDALVAEQERLIALLKEKRQATAHAAVSELTAATPLVELGRVLRAIDQGWSPIAEDRIIEDGEWGVLKLSAVKRGNFVHDQHKALPEGIAPRPELEVKPNDVILTRANTPELVGDACVVTGEANRLVFSDLMYRLEPDPERLSAEYLCLWLLAPQARAQIEADARGSSLSMVKISHRFIRRWILPLPPLHQQKQIVGRIAAENTRTDALITEAERAITLLSERRAALISAAVTGKIDVRGAASGAREAA